MTDTIQDLENRAYGPDITEEERILLRTQVSLLDGEILFWREAPVPSISQLDIYAEKMSELTAGLEQFYLLVDLSRSARPGPEILEHIRKIMQPQTRLMHAAIFTGMNFMVNIGAKFLLARMGIKSYSIHKNQADALGAINDVRK